MHSEHAAVGSSRPPASPADDSSFPQILRARLDNFFIEQNISPKSDATMVVKIVIGIISWAATYAALYAFGLTSWAFVSVYFLHGLTHIFLILNVAHDSNHGAISRNPATNRLFSYAFEACGISSYVFRLIHHREHHACINVYAEDESLNGRRLFRSSPHDSRAWMHKYQHIYALLFYSLFSLDYVFVKDFLYFFGRCKYQHDRRRLARECASLFAGKLAYVTYMIVLPIVILGVSPALVAVTFLVTHLVVGLTVAIVFATSHAVESTSFPKSRADFTDYAYHIFATTADYATGNPIVTWLTGGLNHHVVHHLCPGVCHTHYPRLTQIAKETAAEYRVRYREAQSVRQALTRHLVLLKQLGSQTGPLPTTD